MSAKPGAKGQGRGLKTRGGPRCIHGVLFGGLATPKRGTWVCLSLPCVCLNQVGYIAVVPCALGGSFQELRGIS